MILLFFNQVNKYLCIKCSSWLKMALWTHYCRSSQLGVTSHNLHIFVLSLVWLQTAGPVSLLDSRKRSMNLAFSPRDAIYYPMTKLNDIVLLLDFAQKLKIFIFFFVTYRLCRIKSVFWSFVPVLLQKKFFLLLGWTRICFAVRKTGSISMSVLLLCSTPLFKD